MTLLQFLPSGRLGRGLYYEKRNMEIRHSDDTGCADSHCNQLRCYELHELTKNALRQGIFFLPLSGYRLKKII